LFPTLRVGAFLVERGELRVERELRKNTISFGDLHTLAGITYIREEVSLHTGGDFATYGRKFHYIREEISLHTGGNFGFS
jgi:hypothetical protein